MRNLVKLFLKTLIDPEGTLNETSDAGKSPGSSHVLKVLLVLLIVLLMAVVLVVLKAKFPDINFEGSMTSPAASHAMDGSALLVVSGRPMS